MTHRLYYGNDVSNTLRGFKADWFHCVVTSPPYWGLRNYTDGHEAEIGRERTPAEYVARMVSVCRDIRRVLRPDGTFWLNLGSSYGRPFGGGRPGDKQYTNVGAYKNRGARAGRRESLGKQLVPIPWMVAIALQADGWILRSDIIWHKPNPMTESVRDRPTRAHEYLFLLTKSPRYFYDWYAIAEPTTDESQHTRKTAAKFGGADKADPKVTRLQSGNASDAYEMRNKRDVWTLSTQSYRGAHFATFPERLVEPCILASTSAKGCCSACGAPWVRVIDRERRPTRPGETTKTAGANSRARISRDPLHPSELNGKPDKLVIGNRDPLRHVTEYVDRGFVPGCKCAASTKPCRVLDPFSGSGTTGAVAVRLGRRYTGVDLHGEYEKLAEERIAKALAKVKP